MSLIDTVDTNDTIFRQGKETPVHSRFFRYSGWPTSATALDEIQEPKREAAREVVRKAERKARQAEIARRAALAVEEVKAKADMGVMVVSAASAGVAKAHDRLNAVRFDAKVEEQKVVNLSDDRKAAEALGLSKLTVVKLRAVCKARGLKGYSKARKADLLAMLA